MSSGTTPPPQGTGNTERRIRLVTALVGVAFAVLAGYLAFFRLGGSVRTLSYDLPIVLNSKASADEIRIVYLDELDGEFLDRRAQARLLDKLNEAGARAVVYDLIFDLPSEDPAVDKEFAAAMLRFRGVDEAGEPVAGMPRRPIILACGRQNINQTGVTGEQLIPPTDELLAAADDFGLVTLIHDKKFTVRELTTGSRDEPTLTWKAAIALGTPLEERDRLASRWLNYVGPPNPNQPAIQSCSASNLLLGTVPRLLRDKVVVVGAKPGIVGAAAGLDLFSTPYHRFDLRGDLPLTSGVEIQATGLANLMQRNWLVRSDPRYDLWLVVLAGILAGIGIHPHPPGPWHPRCRGLCAATSRTRHAFHALPAGLVSLERGRISADPGGLDLGHRSALLHRTLLPREARRGAAPTPRCLREIPLAPDARAASPPKVFK